MNEIIVHLQQIY